MKNIEITTEESQKSIYVGGIAGGIADTIVENCYVQGESIKDSKGVDSAIGGIVGLGNNVNTIKNCYAEGKNKFC